VTSKNLRVLPDRRPPKARRRAPARSPARSDYRRLTRRVGKSSSRTRATVLGMALALVLGLAVALNSPLLEVQSITVDGCRELTREQVLDAAGLRFGVNILRVGLRAAASDLSRLPRVAQAEVSRVWPRGLQVVLVERTGLALLPCGSGWLEVAGDGVALQIHPTAQETGLPVLEGIEPALIGVGETVPGAAARAALDALAALEASGDTALRAVLAEPGLEIELADGTWLYLGPVTSGLQSRVGIALTILEELRARGQRVAYIDVRVPGQPLIKPR
jgi:cell division protein FtsQ